mmetsp:Transcript_22143/g.29217  ORF Transcript_22143/g.29217 Transcript_22143/m.29217 type:complete len:505 (-) Transcript_22143:158-1672(-)
MARSLSRATIPHSFDPSQTTQLAHIKDTMGHRVSIHMADTSSSQPSNFSGMARSCKSAAHAACILAVILAAATATPSVSATLTVDHHNAASCFASTSSASNRLPRAGRRRSREGRSAATCLQLRLKSDNEGNAKAKGGRQPTTTLFTRSVVPNRRQRQQMTQLDEEEYARRKREWAAKYTSLSTLRSTFGTNRNKLWGDFDPETTRQLYHTLLPRALLGLHELGLMKPDELAPLAYEARIAAKKYARERCIVPGRVLSMAYDGFRQWKNYGKFNVEGMSWEQIWQKYEQQVINEHQTQLIEPEDDVRIRNKVRRKSDQTDEDDITARICLRILERSCISNDAIDRLILGRGRDEEVLNKVEEEKKKAKDLVAITAKIQQDIDDLLLRPNANDKTYRNSLPTLTPAEVHALRVLVATKKKIIKLLKSRTNERLDVFDGQATGLEIISAAEAVPSATKDGGSSDILYEKKKIWQRRDKIERDPKQRNREGNFQLLRRMKNFDPAHV